jgi:hypothetical protein
VKVGPKPKPSGTPPPSPTPSPSGTSARRQAKAKEMELRLFLDNAALLVAKSRALRALVDRDASPAAFETLMRPLDRILRDHARYGGPAPREVPGDDLDPSPDLRPDLLGGGKPL